MRVTVDPSPLERRVARGHDRAVEGDLPTEDKPKQVEQRDERKKQNGENSERFFHLHDLRDKLRFQVLIFESCIVRLSAGA